MDVCIEQGKSIQTYNFLRLIHDYLAHFSGLFIKEFMKAYKISTFLMDYKYSINSVK